MEAVNEHDARNMLQGHVNKPLGFCPLIKEPCNMDCVCYKKAFINNVGSLWYFYKESCESPFVSGTILAEY